MICSGSQRPEYGFPERCEKDFRHGCLGLPYFIFRFSSYLHEGGRCFPPPFPARKSLKSMLKITYKPSRVFLCSECCKGEDAGKYYLLKK